jgi:hypothetical protein
MSASTLASSRTSVGTRQAGAAARLELGDGGGQAAGVQVGQRDARAGMQQRARDVAADAARAAGHNGYL